MRPRETRAPGKRLSAPVPGQLRVGIFTDDFYPDSGGVCRSIELQLAELVRRGYHGTLFSPHVNFTPPPAGDYTTIPTWRVPYSPSYMCSLQFSDALARRIARRFTFDVVHSQNERGSMVLAAKIANLQGIPHVHTFHSNYAGTHATTPRQAWGSSMLFLPLASRVVRRASARPLAVSVRRPAPVAGEDSPLAVRDWMNVTRLAACPDAVTSPAPFLVDTVVRASGGALAGRASVVPSGVSSRFTEVRRRRPVGAGIRFLSCGRLGAEKRVDAIVRAFALLGRDDAELVIAGGGPEEGALKQLARTVRHGSVRFTGHIGDVGEVAQTIADADVFVLASYRFDTQGMVLAESAAAGTPILYCDDRLSVGVGPDNALLVEPTVEGLAAGMRTLAEDRARLAAMAEATASLRAGLTTAAMGERYEAIYRAAIARVGGHTS